MIIVNSVIYSESEILTGDVGYFRVVGIRNNEAYLFRLDTPVQKAPITCQLNLLNFAIDYKIRIIGDFIINLPRSEEQLSDKGKIHLHETLQFMTPIINDEEIIFCSKKRGSAFRLCASAAGKTPRTIRRLFYDYLWSGCTILAFARYIHTGGPKQQSVNTAKRGPKPKSPFETSNFALPAVYEQLVKGAKRYFLHGEYTFEEAYTLTMDSYFTGTRLKRSKNIRLSETKKHLPSASLLPTKRQFRYVCDKLVFEQGSRPKLPRKMRPEEELKVPKGKVRGHVPGPGYRFEIDSTKIQVELVSMFNRSWIIGNATLFIVVDVWSAAIVGYAISLENSKWSLASQCLHNCFQDKTETFARLKLPYSNEDWICHELPTNLTADRAEFLTDKADNFFISNIRVEILEAMRPDLKPLVERTFSEIKHGHFFPTPGKYAKFLKRREKDGKSNAVMTLDEFEKIVIEVIMGINNDPQNVSNIPTEMLRENQPDVTRMGIYKWGLKNLTGYTRTMSSENVKSFLLIKGTATVKPNGLYYKGERYLSPRLLEGGYQARATKYGQYQIEIRYRELPFDEIYFLDDANNTWEAAIACDESGLFKKLSIEEFEFLQQYKQHLIDQAKATNILAKLYRKKELMKKVKEYTRLTRSARLRNPSSNSKNNMRSHRKLEKLGRQLQERIKQSKDVMLLTTPAPAEPIKKGENPAKPSISSRTKELWDRMT